MWSFDITSNPGKLTRVRALKVPAPQPNYGHLRVTGPPFRVPDRKRHKADGTPVIYSSWWVPCNCELCDNPLNVRWESLKAGTSTQCDTCRQAAAATRMAETAEFLAMRRDKHPWHRKGDGYLYATTYGDVLKIGYSTSRPGMNIHYSNIRFFKYTGKEIQGQMVWHQPGTVADEAIIQGICNKIYGAATFPYYHGGWRVSEWINCPDLNTVLTQVEDTYEFAQSL